MAVIAIFNASFCQADTVVGRLAERLQYRGVTDAALLSSASERHGIAPEVLDRAMRGAPGFFNRLTREKERSVSALREAMVSLLEQDDFVYHGFGALLVPRSLAHVLRVCLAAPRESRLGEAEKQGLSGKEAERRIDQDDLACAEWTKFLFDLGPWDKSLYDVFLPMQSMTAEQAVDRLCDYARRPALRTTEETRGAVADARLAAAVDMALVKEGYDTDVSCKGGVATVLIRKPVLRMRHLQEKLEKIALQVPGVNRAEARPGPRCQEPSVYAPLDVEVPSKVLLVDDEREFVHTLSERLQARQMRPAVAYDGEEALSMVEADQPDVMVLDLKMPGVDGLEVLRRVKQRHPRTEVIILTGHGSDRERQVALQLGAFAYLRKPVDIDVLTRTMKDAYRKAGSQGGGAGSPGTEGS